MKRPGSQPTLRADLDTPAVPVRNEHCLPRSFFAKRILCVLIVLLVSCLSGYAETGERVSLQLPNGPYICPSPKKLEVQAGSVLVTFRNGRLVKNWPHEGEPSSYQASDSCSSSILSLSINFSKPVTDVRFRLIKDNLHTWKINGVDAPKTLFPVLPNPGQSITISGTGPVGGSIGWELVVDSLSFVGSAFDTVPSAPIFSPRKPGKEKDTRVVVNASPGLDTRCSFRNQGPLRIDIPMKRVVGDVDALGRLLDPYSLIQNRYLSKAALLTLAAYDVDPSENDRVFFNDHELPKLKGSNNQWTTNQFTIPIEWVRFARFAEGFNIESVNDLRIEIDQPAVGDPKWCTSIDWVQLEFNAIAPILLVHGTNSGPGTWEDGIVEFLDSVGVPYTNAIQLKENGSIKDNGEQLAKRVSYYCAQAFGADECHLVAHSKGGNDSREFLLRHYDSETVKVLSLYTLSTPFRGTVIADIFLFARGNQGRDSSNPNISELLSRDYWFLPTPCCEALRDNTTNLLTNYNIHNPSFPDEIKFYNFAADADGNDDSRISFAERTPQIPDLILGWLNSIGTAAANAQYLALASIKSVEVSHRITDSLGSSPETVPMIEVKEWTGSFEDNDLVVTVESAQHPKAVYLGQIDANHSTLKSSDVMQGILSRIQSDFPLKEPKP